MILYKLSTSEISDKKDLRRITHTGIRGNMNRVYAKLKNPLQCLILKYTFFFTEKYRVFEKGFLVNNKWMFAMHEVNSVNGQQKGLRQLNMRSYIETITIETFAVDAKLNIIYFFDSGHLLKKLDMISEETSTLISSFSGRGNFNNLYILTQHI